MLLLCQLRKSELTSMYAESDEARRARLVSTNQADLKNWAHLLDPVEVGRRPDGRDGGVMDGRTEDDDDCKLSVLFCCCSGTALEPGPAS